MHNEAVQPQPAVDDERIGVSRKKWWLIVVFTGLVLGILAVAGYLPRWRAQSEVRRVTVALSIPTVKVTNAFPAVGQEGLMLSAEVRPFQEVSLHARARGYVKRYNVDLGAEVEAGQVLLEIETPEVDQELAQARAQLRQTEATLRLAVATAARWRDLLKTSTVSEQETSEKVAEESLRQAAVLSATANVRRLEELTAFSKMTAPFAGSITMRRVEMGELINPDTPKELFRLAQTKTLRVSIAVPQSLARDVGIGTRAEVFFQEFPGRAFLGEVRRESGSIDADSRTRQVELELDNKNGKLLAGSFAQVRFPQAQLEGRLALPANCLMYRPEGPTVAVVKGGNQLELRLVKVGRDFGQTIEIVGGVEASESVVINPADSLVSGVRVRLMGK